MALDWGNTDDPLNPTISWGAVEDIAQWPLHVHADQLRQALLEVAALVDWTWKTSAALFATQLVQDDHRLLERVMAGGQGLRSWFFHFDTELLGAFSGDSAIFASFVNHSDNGGDWKGDTSQNDVAPYWTEADLWVDLGEARIWPEDAPYPPPAGVGQYLPTAAWCLQRRRVLDCLLWTRRAGAGEMRITSSGWASDAETHENVDSDTAVDAASAGWNAVAYTNALLTEWAKPGAGTASQNESVSPPRYEGNAKRVSGVYTAIDIPVTLAHSCDFYLYPAGFVHNSPYVDDSYDNTTWDAEGAGWTQGQFFRHVLPEATAAARSCNTLGAAAGVPPKYPAVPPSNDYYTRGWTADSPIAVLKWDGPNGRKFHA